MKQNGKTNVGSGLFKQAGNLQAYLKAGMLGFPGSGKTYTAWLIARGLIEKLSGKGDKRPLLFLDTETGSDFLVTLAKEAKVPLYVAKTRAFSDLVQGVVDAEKEGAVLVIDSITHFWQELLTSYAKAKGRTGGKLYFQDWGPIKETWRGFTDLFINSKTHILMCGRAGYEYDYGTDADGQKQLEKVGTKMKAETDMGYEPSLLIEMVREPKGGNDEPVAGKSAKKKKVHGQLWDHNAYILKDRTRTMEGAKFINPTFENFAPHINYLNLGGEHVGVDTHRSSEHLFPTDWDKVERKKSREIVLEEIKNEMVRAFPGTTGKSQQSKLNIIKSVFNTTAWGRVEQLPLEVLEQGLEKVKAMIEALQNGPVNAG